MAIRKEQKMTLSELLRKKKKPNRIIYDFIVYKLKDGEYWDKFGKPLQIKGTYKELTTAESVYVVEGE